ncbi:cyclodeaminase/cyclohydrolase family protein [Candidatus Ozemobacteraceae bacterium]|nr:cyclodeaminase/cyclohydrolase family protein [Candidatus Ozemobacteraceae bacterium]
MDRMLSKTLRAFCDDVASDSFAPGGGCVSAVSGALSASLGHMVLLLTCGKKKYAEFDADNTALKGVMKKHQEALLACVERDIAGCDAMLAAMALPKETDADKAVRKIAMQKASKTANDAPLAICEETIALLRSLDASVGKVNQNAITDWACAALQAYAALEGAALNAKINCGGAGDPVYEADVRGKLRAWLDEGRRLMESVRDRVHSGLDAAN